MQAVLARKHLKVYMKDGKVLSERTVARRSPGKSMTFNEVADKFRGNANLPSGRCRKRSRSSKLVKSLESAPHEPAKRGAGGLSDPTREVTGNRSVDSVALSGSGPFLRAPPASQAYITQARRKN